MKRVIKKSYTWVISFTGPGRYTKTRNPFDQQPGMFPGGKKIMKVLALVLCAAFLALAVVQPVQSRTAQSYDPNSADRLSQASLHPVKWVSPAYGYAGPGGAEGVTLAVDTAQAAILGLGISLSGALILAVGVFALSRRKA